MPAVVCTFTFSAIGSPESFYLGITFMTLAMLVVGGMNSLWGAVLGTLVVTTIGELLLRVELASGVLNLREVGLALVMLAILILRPRGITSGLELEWYRVRDWTGWRFVRALPARASADQTREATMNTRLRVAVDVGGTFTDLVAVDSDGNFRFTKVPTTNPDYQRGVIDAVRAADVRFQDIEILLHGLTIATNAVVARTGARTGLVGTKGFRDLLEIRRANRPREGMYDVSWEPSPPLVPRRDRLTVAERIDYLGKRSHARGRERGAGRGAGLFASAGSSPSPSALSTPSLNPENERTMARILQEECPDASITLSSELIPVILEFERTSTAVVNAYTGADRPALHGPAQRGLPGRAVWRRNSRHAVLGRRYDARWCRAPRGAHDHVGTGRRCDRRQGAGRARRRPPTSSASTWAARARTSRRFTTARFARPRSPRSISAFPWSFPSIDMITIGAGRRGTIAWIDEGGVLKSGPASAGSAPGPACYGAGGAEATNTDANMVLGSLNPEGLAGGAMTLRPELAREAVERIADRLGMDVTKAAKRYHHGLQRQHGSGHASR